MIVNELEKNIGNYYEEDRVGLFGRTFKAWLGYKAIFPSFQHLIECC